MGKRVILTPILIMSGFALFSVLLHYLKVVPARFLSAGLEMILPLAAGVVVATIVSHDLAIELQLTMPKKYDISVMLRLLLIFCWSTCIAILSASIISALGLGYTPQELLSWFGPLQFLTNSLTWFAPLLWFVAVGLCLALLTRSRSASGAILAGIWLAEILFKDYIAVTDWLRPVLLFPTTLLLFPVPNLPQWVFDLWLNNRFEVLGTALLLLPLGWLLLQNKEGLLKGVGEE
jgi:hypothetical protein